MRTHWSRLTLVYDEAGVVHDEGERRRLLTELRGEGSMRGAFLTRTWSRHENPVDRRTWGPTRKEIDWEGFDTKAPRPLSSGDEPLSGPTSLPVRVGAVTPGQHVVSSSAGSPGLEGFGGARFMSDSKVRFPGSGEFFAELKRRVAAHLEAEGSTGHDAPAMYLKTAVILGWLLASYLGLLLWAHTVPQIVALAVSAGLAMAGLGFNIQHDGNHGGYSQRPWVNRLMALTLDLVGGSSYVWHWKHNVIHHTYSNVDGVDADVQVGFFARLAPSQARRGFHRFQHLYLWLLYGLLPFKWIFLDDFLNLATGRIGTQHFPRPKRGELALALGMKVLYFGWALALPLWLHPFAGVALAYAVSAVTLGVSLAVVFQLAHCHEAAEFPLPDAAHRMGTDWASHQVATTVDFARDSRALTWLLGGLNFQVEHHLFPRVCHVHYPAISKIVEATCRDYGVRFRTHATLVQALRAHARWLYRMGHVPAAA